MTTAGEHFARAVAAKDAAALAGVLADGIDFQALTPGRPWQAVSPRQVADEIVLGCWFGPGATITGLAGLTHGQVGGREHVAYRLQVTRDGQDYLVEQQAYYDTEGGQISWMRVLCAGYQPASAHQAGPAAPAPATAAAR
jgi:hypothetical protein